MQGTAPGRGVTGIPAIKDEMGETCRTVSCQLHHGFNMPAGRLLVKNGTRIYGRGGSSSRRTADRGFTPNTNPQSAIHNPQSRGSGGFGEGEGEGEGGAGVGVVSGPDAAAVAFDDLLGEGQTQAGAVSLDGPRVVGTVELLEDMRHGFGRDADPRIGDRHADRIAVILDLQGHPAAILEIPD